MGKHKLPDTLKSTAVLRQRALDLEKLDASTDEARLIRNMALGVSQMIERQFVGELSPEDRSLCFALQQDATEARLRAERHIGSKIRPPRGGPGRGKKFDRERTFFEEHGITPDQSSLWQRLAKYPKPKFEAYVSSCRNRQQDMYPKRLYRLVREYFARDGDRTEEVAPLPQSIRVECCDFRELMIPEKSVDLLFTDPPYPKKYIKLWSDLGAFAERALKPDGLLIAYSGQYHLPDVINALCERLSYVWLGALLLYGHSTQVHARRVRCSVKPLLFFSPGGEKPRSWFEDTFVSKESPDKLSHRWQQGIAPAVYYIETLTRKGQLVCDPFLGSGTTGVASVQLGRSFVGCDVDDGAVRVARKRIAEWQEKKSQGSET